MCTLNANGIHLQEKKLLGWPWPPTLPHSCVSEWAVTHVWLLPSSPPPLIPRASSPTSKAQKCTKCPYLRFQQKIYWAIKNLKLVGYSLVIHILSLVMIVADCNTCVLHSCPPNSLRARLGKNKLHKLCGVHLLKRFSAKFVLFPLNLALWTCKLEITLRMSSS